ncbi:STE3 [Phaffia rhodozyma]|uniref:STE3 n=2 Tax=Phaffia rhodozyma TaxID=264483 RepID=A0A0F7SXD0_PHARH|nr:STE3 [Phaffia rhodozyma]
MRDALFPIYSGLAILLLLMACGPHVRARNVGAISLMTWCMLANITYFINALVYQNTAEDLTPIWCDVVVKIQCAVQTGLAASCLCINRRLATISSPTQSRQTETSRQWAFWSDVAICLLPTTLVLIVSYCVQAHRYNIVENFGCFPATWLELYAILGLFVPPILCAAGSFICGGFAIYNFLAQRRRFQAVLQQHSSSLNSSRFLRLIGVAAVDMVLSLPFGIYEIIHNSYNLQPTYSWADLHHSFDLVQETDQSILNAQPGSWASINLSRWTTTLAAFIYFAFFGMHEDALSFHASTWNKITAAFSYIWMRAFGTSEPPSYDSSHLTELGTTVASVSDLNRFCKSSKDEEAYFAYENMIGSDKSDSDKGVDSKISVTVRIQKTIS